MEQRKVSFVIGRFQPLHEGHKALIQKLLDEGKRVCLGIMGTEADEENPYSFYERFTMVQEAFGDKVEFVTIPPIAEVCFGRNVGYKIRRYIMARKPKAYQLQIFGRESRRKYVSFMTQILLTVLIGWPNRYMTFT